MGDGKQRAVPALLGINEPWTVDRVDLDMTQGRVDVYVGHTKGVRLTTKGTGVELF